MPKCPECGADVSASDKRCRKCGTKVNKDSSKLIIGIVIVVVIIAIAGAFASGIFTGSDSNGGSSKEVVDPIVEDAKNGDDSNSSESATTEYWASDKADKFHLPSCEWAEKIGGDNKIVYHSREDAIADGKEPCSACNP